MTIKVVSIKGGISTQGKLLWNENTRTQGSMDGQTGQTALKGRRGQTERCVLCEIQRQAEPLQGMEIRMEALLGGMMTRRS